MEPAAAPLEAPVGLPRQAVAELVVRGSPARRAARGRAERVVRWPAEHRAPGEARLAATTAATAGRRPTAVRAAAWEATGAILRMPVLFIRFVAGRRPAPQVSNSAASRAATQRRDAWRWAAHARTAMTGSRATTAPIAPT